MDIILRLEIGRELAWRAGVGFPLITRRLKAALQWIRGCGDDDIVAVPFREAEMETILAKNSTSIECHQLNWGVLASLYVRVYTYVCTYMYILYMC